MTVEGKRRVGPIVRSPRLGPRPSPRRPSTPGPKGGSAVPLLRSAQDDRDPLRQPKLHHGSDLRHGTISRKYGLDTIMAGDERVNFPRSAGDYV